MNVGMCRVAAHKTSPFSTSNADEPLRVMQGGAWARSDVVLLGI